MLVVIFMLHATEKIMLAMRSQDEELRHRIRIPFHSVPSKHLAVFYTLSIDYLYHAVKYYFFVIY